MGVVVVVGVGVGVGEEEREGPGEKRLGEELCGEKEKEEEGVTGAVD